MKIKSAGCLLGHKGRCFDTLSLPDGRLLTASEDGTCRAWDLRTKREVSCFNHQQSAFNAAREETEVLRAMPLVLPGQSWSGAEGEGEGVSAPLQQHVCTAGADGKAIVWTATGAGTGTGATGAVTVTAERCLDHGQGVQIYACERLRTGGGSGGGLLMTAADDVIRIWDLGQGQRPPAEDGEGPGRGRDQGTAQDKVQVDARHAWRFNSFTKSSSSSSGGSGGGDDGASGGQIEVSRDGGSGSGGDSGTAGSGAGSSTFGGVRNPDDVCYIFDAKPVRHRRTTAGSSGSDGGGVTDTICVACSDGSVRVVEAGLGEGAGAGAGAGEGEKGVAGLSPRCRHYMLLEDIFGGVGGEGPQRPVYPTALTTRDAGGRADEASPFQLLVSLSNGAVLVCDTRDNLQAVAVIPAAHNAACYGCLFLPPMARSRPSESQQPPVPPCERENAGEIGEDFGEKCTVTGPLPTPTPAPAPAMRNNLILSWSSDGRVRVWDLDPALSGAPESLVVTSSVAEFHVGTTTATPASSPANRCPVYSCCVVDAVGASGGSDVAAGVGAEERTGQGQGLEAGEGAGGGGWRRVTIACGVGPSQSGAGGPMGAFLGVPVQLIDIECTA